ncbi:MAG TPA: patatin-like phospholipase family protein [Balneolales bacterium]|nr:patatin-like phospholipase family protein [Balneolales bacterium]
MANKRKHKIGLACAGGAIEGAAYEIGALRALDEALEGISFDDLDVYVGVSSGAFITSCLANKISTKTLAKAFISKVENVLPITPTTFFTPAFDEYQKRLFKIPGLITESFMEYLLHPFDISLGGAFFKLTSAIPVGLFNNEKLREFLEKNFAIEGRTDDFKKLEPTLRVIATNVENSKIVRFGEPPNDKIPISKAVQASTALPVLYMPVKINGDYYIDGVARKTVHASVALEEGADLVFCINPIVPIDAKQLDKVEHQIKDGLIEQGLPSVLSQTFRMMIHSRMKAGFKNYEYAYPDSDFIVIEPKPSDYEMFYTNIFSFTNRRKVCEYAYQTTRKNLLERANEIQLKLKKYGIKLRIDILEDKTRTLYQAEDEKDIPTSGSDAINKVDNVLEKLDRILEKIETAA